MERPTSVQDDLVPWLGHVLAGHGALADAELTVIGQGEGFVGQLARARLQWSEQAPGAPASVIVKLPTADPTGRTMGQLMGLYDREHRFYAELAAEVPVRVPRAYANLADPAAGWWALVLEDLAPMRPGDQVLGADAATARVAVEQIARFHAHFYRRSLDDLAWMPPLIGPMTQMVVPMFESSWPAFVEQYGAKVPERALRWTEAFAPKVPAWMETYASVPVTVVHGDYRLDNLFFGDAGEFAMIDWQMPMRVPGSSDLVYFLLTNLTAVVRRAHERELIELYIDTLRRNGIGEDLLPGEIVRRGYREGALLYAVMFVSTVGYERANARGEAFFDALVGRTFTAVDDLDAGTLLGV
ncbi:MAG: phosphotransferase [Acidimicrobiales bacterium]